MSELSIFFDVEFSNFEHPELISLGAITADGAHEFYAEVSPLPERCSDFVREHVIPQLSGPCYPKAELAAHFIGWLNRFDKDIELCSDSSYDRDLVYAMCGYPIPLARHNMVSWYPLPHLITNNPHHALRDAKMLRDRFSAQL